MTGPIDRYLDELFVELRSSVPGEARALLTEAEAHLRDAAESARARGLDEVKAEEEAVARFGPARQLAVTDRRRDGANLVTRVVVSGWWLGSIGALAVGASGVLAGLMRLAGAGNQFIAGSGPAVAWPGDCARWLRLYPDASSCANAALNDWAFETVAYRILLGLLGAGALAVLLLARRYSPWAYRLTPLPRLVVDTIACTAFGVAAVGLTGLGVDALAVTSGDGAGQWFSAAPVAVAAALVFGIRLLRDLRRPAA